MRHIDRWLLVIRVAVPYVILMALVCLVNRADADIGPDLEADLVYSLEEWRYMAKKKPKARPGFEAALLKEEGRQRILYSQEPVGKRGSQHGSARLTREEVLKHERKRKLRQAKMGVRALLQGTMQGNRIKAAEKALYEGKLRKPVYKR